MTTTTRPAMPDDFRVLAQLLNRIIEIGGTTAYTDPVTADYLLQKSETPGSHWSVAINDAQIIGFQWIAPNDALPEGACDIASFVDPDAQGKGAGQVLFPATYAAARGLGYGWINATIRADNVPGLAYYSGLGFVDWNRENAITLGDGTVTDRIKKRFDLTG